jgi:hypothetical protein
MGRPKGSPNKTTRAAKEFLASLCEDPKVQAAVRRKILKGDTTGFFRAVDKIVPDPPKAVDLSIQGRMYLMPGGEDIEGLNDGPEAA